MYLVDYHTHSKFSFDGKEKPDAMCKKAIAQGLSEIAITDHVEIFHRKPYDYKIDCDKLYAKLWELKSRYMGQLKVIVGAELGQPQVNRKEADCFLRDYGPDFVIGSVHNLWDDTDVADMHLEQMDVRKVYEEYLTQLNILAKGLRYDVLGHITYPSRYIFAKTGKVVEMRDYAERYREILQYVIDRGRGIEINLSGPARGTGGIMPDMEILKLYQGLGGEIITIGSDAHVLSQIGSVSKLGCELLKEAGFRYFTVYEERLPRFVYME